MPTEPLPSLVRARVLEMLREAREAAGSRATYTALVVDESTLRVLSRGVKVSELMDDANAITVVESITTPREARTSEDLASCMDVIYFLTPSVSSVRALIGDYEGRSRMYGGGAHVFFSRSLPAALMDELRASPVVPHLRSLREVNLDFVAIQPHAFSLDAPSALQILYGPWGESRARVVAKYAEQAYTACATLGELAPHVRYARNHPVCKAFANELSRLLEAGSAAQVRPWLGGVAAGEGRTEHACHVPRRCLVPPRRPQRQLRGDGRAAPCSCSTVRRTHSPRWSTASPTRLSPRRFAWCARGGTGALTLRAGRRSCSLTRTTCGRTCATGRTSRQGQTVA